jgi:hypothetical protein
MDENQTPAPEAQPAPPKQQFDWSAIRDAAFAKVTTRVRALQNLEKISKGAGKPSLNELTDLFTGIATCLAALPREQQKQGEVLYTMLVNFSLRLDAIFAILEEKAIVGKDELQAKMTTILDEQKALIRQRKEDALAKSVEQTKKPE